MEPLERKDLTMLSALPQAIKEDAVTHRVATVEGILSRLHVLYAPGGAAERTVILTQLEHHRGDHPAPTLATDPHESTRDAGLPSGRECAAEGSGVDHGGSGAKAPGHPSREMIYSCRTGQLKGRS